MLHNLGLAMAYHSSSGSDVLGFHWCAELSLCLSLRGAAHCCGFVAFSFLSVLAIMTVVEGAVPGTAQLKGKPALLAVPWFALSLCLNVIVTSMICFRILRVRALTRATLSPEVSKMYTSIATILIESAVPFSILGVGLVITVAMNVAPSFAFAYIWSIFCVEFESSRVKGELLNFPTPVSPFPHK
jgi:hypothetical protein